jgi:hypothetical protein
VLRGAGGGLLRGLYEAVIISRQTIVPPSRIGTALS